MLGKGLDRIILAVFCGGVLGFDYVDFGDLSRVHHWTVAFVVLVYLVFTELFHKS